MTEAEYTARIAAVINRAMRPTLDELIADGSDLDSRVTLTGGEGDWENLRVPEDTVPGERVP